MVFSKPNVLSFVPIMWLVSPSVFCLLSSLACTTEGIFGISMWAFLSFSFPSMSLCALTSKFLPFNFTVLSSTKGKLWALLIFRVQTCKYKCCWMVPIPLARLPVCGEGHPDMFWQLAWSRSPGLGTSCKGVQDISVDLAGSVWVLLKANRDHRK